MTKKNYRKKINSIYISIKYDLLKDDLVLEELIIDNQSNENTKNFIKEFNQDNKPIRNKMDLRNFFNSLIEEL